MRFLANENVPLTSIDHLRNEGHDVASISEEASGSNDVEVLERAAREDRVILTFDSDYGELIFRRKLPSPRGVLFFRVGPLTPLDPALRILQLLNASGISLDQKFTVVERSQIRQRSLP